MQSEPSEAMLAAGAHAWTGLFKPCPSALSASYLAMKALDTDFTRTDSPTDAVEALGEALCTLSDRLRRIGALDSDNVHVAYEKVVAAFQALPPSAALRNSTDKTKLEVSYKFFHTKQVPCNSTDGETK